MFKKIFTITAFFVGLLLLRVLPVQAAPLSLVSVRLDRINESTASSQTIYMVTPTGVSAGQTITLTYPGSSFAFGGSYDHTDMALAEGDSGNCSTATFTPKTVGASASGATWGATYSSNTVTFTSGTGTVTAGRCIRIILSSNGAGHTITNPSVSGNTNYNVAATAGSDTGNAAVIILDDAGTPDGDQVLIEAELITSITMDLDIVTTNCNNSTENAPPYTIDLGSLVPGQVRVSGATIGYICVDLGTSSLAGLRFMARSSRSNAVGGLVTTGGVIESNTADLTQESTATGYGIRVSSLGTASFGTFTASSPFNNGSTANIGQLPGTLASPANVVTSTAPVQTGGSSRIAIEIAAKADSGIVTGAYSDTIVFSAMINF